MLAAAMAPDFQDCLQEYIALKAPVQNCKLNCVTPHRAIALMKKEMGNERNEDTGSYIAALVAR